MKGYVDGSDEIEIPQSKPRFTENPLRSSMTDTRGGRSSTSRLSSSTVVSNNSAITAILPLVPISSIKQDPRDKQLSCLDHLLGELSDEEEKEDEPCLKPEAMWDLRLTKNNPFIMPKDYSKDVTYFDLQGRAHPEKHGLLGEYKELSPAMVKSDLVKEILTLSNARTNRLKHFQDASSQMVRAEDDDLHRLKEVIIDIQSEPDIQREIICSLDIVEIDGLPTTTHHTKVEGSIQVAIVKSPNLFYREGGNMSKDNIQLAFSVAEGTAKISVNEIFRWRDTMSRIFVLWEYVECTDFCRWLRNCCGSDTFMYISFLFGQYEAKTVDSNYEFGYKSNIEFTNQYAVLPVQNMIVDAIAHRETSRLFSAEAKGSFHFKETFDERTCYDKFCCCCTCQCCKPCCDACALRCRKCTACGICLTLWPICCHINDDGSINNKVKFEVNDEHKIGQELSKDVKVISEADGVEWTVAKGGVDDIFVTLVYRNMYNNNVMKCKMKCRVPDQSKSSETFLRAKNFVNVLADHRTQFEHGVIDVQPVHKPHASFNIEAFLKLFNSPDEMLKRKEEKSREKKKRSFWNCIETIRANPRKSFWTFFWIFIIILIIIIEEEKKKNGDEGSGGGGGGGGAEGSTDDAGGDPSSYYN